MKAIYKNIALAALALSAVACTQEEDFAPSFLNDPDAIHITAQVASGNVTGGFTRSNPLGTTDEQAKFNNGDAIAVTARNQDAVTYTFNGTTWTPEEGKYLKWEANSMNFTAWYPVGEGTDANTFTVPTSYADVNAMADADYMVYSGSQSKPDGNSVTLPMVRKMARIVITPVLNDEFATGYSITGIKVHANTSGYANGEPQTGDIQVSALKQGNAYYALLAPTTADANATFLTVTVTKTDDSTSQELTVKGIPTTVAGQSYDYTLTVGKAEATIGSVKVNPWTDGTINGGKAEEVIPYVTFKAGDLQTLDLVQISDEDYDEYYPYPGFGDDTGYIEYSVGDNDTWTKFELNPKSPPVEFGDDKGDLRLRGISPKGTLWAQIVFGDSKISVACSGDIRTLVDWKNYATADTRNAIFRGLFKGCSVLTSAPELPATTLAPYCYYSMFADCTNLAAAPELPATTLANECYGMMFHGCTSLAAAPKLPATKLANNCYNGMFQGCSSLTEAPELLATTLAGSCCISMFRDCKSLTSAPALLATTLVKECYYDMFSGCTKLNSVTMLATGFEAEATDCLTNWLKDVAATGTFTKAASLEKGTEFGKIPTGDSGIPEDWDIINVE